MCITSNLTHEHFGQPFMVTKTTCCLVLPDNYTFTDGQKDTRALQGLLILAIFDRSESLSVVVDGAEIIFELPDFMICICKAK